eukprot:6191092-Pleurochrysis_carterae.AAC.1
MTSSQILKETYLSLVCEAVPSREHVRSLKTRLQQVGGCRHDSTFQAGLGGYATRRGLCGDASGACVHIALSARPARPKAGLGNRNNIRSPPSCSRANVLKKRRRGGKKRWAYDSLPRN